MKNLETNCDHIIGVIKTVSILSDGSRINTISGLRLFSSANKKKDIQFNFCPKCGENLKEA